jgi:cell division protein WhiA
MSFSSAVKNELCRIEINDSCCLLSELAAVIRIIGQVRSSGAGDINIRVTTESPAFARRVFTIVKRLYDIHPEVIARKSKKLKKHTSYILVITASMGARKMLNNSCIEVSKEGVSGPPIYANINNILKNSCCKRSYLRAAFLAAGSISDPEKTYHLEIANHSIGLARELAGMINKFGLNSKIIKRKGYSVIYLKEGENIVDFLNIIGAHSALLEMENLRILKGMRNDVNRIVNCETANLEKTVNAAWRQVENINYIKEHLGFDNLPDNLREIAELRLEYPDLNLKELGDMLKPTLGKSGVNHRLRKLDEIADKVRSSKGE